MGKGFGWPGGGRVLPGLDLLTFGLCVPRAVDRYAGNQLPLTASGFIGMPGQGMSLNVAQCPGGKRILSCGGVRFHRDADTGEWR